MRWQRISLPTRRTRIFVKWQRKRSLRLSLLFLSGRRRSSCFLSLPTHRIARTLFLRSVVVQVEMRQRFLLETSSVCTRSISRHVAGEWKSPTRQKVQPVDSRKSFVRCLVRVFTEFLSMSQVCTVYSVCLRQRLRVVYIHLRLQLQCFQRQMSSISSSI